MAQTFLTLRDVVVRHGAKIALQIAHLDVASGEVLALLGANGAGKSTLLRVMGLLQASGGGQVTIDGVAAHAGNALTMRRRIGTVFQEPLLLNDTVFRNAALGLRLRGLAKREIQRRLNPWLERLGIAHLANRSARTLSGGEAQRTSLARALVLEPELLLLDEPFSALDPASRAVLLDDFLRIVKETKLTTVLVTHDRQEAYGLADRVGLLDGGRLLQLGLRDDVFLRPQSVSAAAIVGMDNRLSGYIEGRDGRLAAIEIDGQKLYAQAPFAVGIRVMACIRAEDIIVNGPHSDGCGPNRYTAQVVEVAPGVAQQRVTLTCGVLRLVASVERKVFAEVGLRQGDQARVSIAPAAVHVIEDR